MTLTVTAYFVLPLLLALGMIVFLWFYYANRRHSSDRYPGEGKIYRCEHCRLVYVERRMYPLLECPRCHHPNQAIRR
jgi:hypothetical protein